MCHSQDQSLTLTVRHCRLKTAWISLMVANTSRPEQETLWFVILKLSGAQEVLPNHNISGGTRRACDEPEDKLKRAGQEFTRSNGLKPTDGDAHRLLTVNIDSNYNSWHEKACNFMKTYWNYPTNLQHHWNVNRSRSVGKGRMVDMTIGITTTRMLTNVRDSSDEKICHFTMTARMSRRDSLRIVDRQRRHDEGWTW
eukprot:2455402-Amphidinium_carterae.1